MLPSNWLHMSSWEFVTVLVALCGVLMFGFGISPTSAQEDDGPGDPLYLTPLIRAGNISEAVEAALNPLEPSVVSYSGYITVNDEHNSNIFFWFFPAEGSYDSLHDNDIPVILWNDGGPGISCTFSVFGYTGPFKGDADGNGYTLNPLSFHKKYHMIYMDNPVEVGFSYADNEEGRVTSGPEAARDIYKFLIQFFSMFPHLRRNPFYNGGTSYGGTYAVQTASIIHQKNLDEPELYINLTGLLLDSPWIDPISQCQYAEPLYTFGLINENTKNSLKLKEEEIQSLLEEDKFVEAKRLWSQMTQVEITNLTGYGSINDVYTDIPSFSDMTPLVTKNATRRQLHVGDKKFVFVSTEQQDRMEAGFMRSSKPELDTLLKAGYRVLLYVGNMDILTGHLGYEKMFKSMEWEGANQLTNGTKSIHKLNDRVTSYVTSVSGDVDVEYVMIRNAGHGTYFGQPEWTLDHVKRFVDKIRNK